MNNLKRVLSLGLTGAMLSGMMLVGASAADVKDFSDAAEIKNKEAVTTMSALGVIAGKDTGAFDPSATVTRAEMAKMITIMLNGGKEPVLSTNATPAYSDIGGHWAQKYIEYCSKNGIIAGQGDGTFNPDGTVTGSQAAKMALVALGYDSNVFNFTGIDWEVNVNSTANAPECDLYDDLSGLNPSEGLSRDNAAQLLYNALDARVMDRNYDSVASSGEVTYKYSLSNVTMMEKKFDAVKVEGVVVANEVADLASTADKGNSLDANRTRISVTNYGTGNGEQDDFKTSLTVQAATGLEDLGRSVNVYVKKNSSASKAEVLGSVIVSADNTVVTDYSADSISKVADDNSLKIVSGTMTAANYGGSATLTSANANAAGTRGVEKVLIDNDDDGNVDYVLLNTYAFGKVTSYVTSGDGSITVTAGQAMTASDKDDVVGFDDVKKDDYVLAAYIGGNLYVEKAESVTGELKSYKVDSSTSKATKLEVDGTNYNVSWIAGYTGGADSITAATGYGPNNLDTEATFYLGKGDYIAAVGEVVENAYNYALVLGVGTAIDDQVKVVLSDGSVGTYTVNTNGDTYKNGGGAGYFDVGSVCSYSIGSNGKIKLTEATGTNLSTAKFTKGKTALTDGSTVKGYTNANTSFFYVDGSMGGTTIDSKKVNTYTGYASAPSLTGTVTGKYITNAAGRIVAVLFNGTNITKANVDDNMYIYSVNNTSSDYTSVKAFVAGSTDPITDLKVDGKGVSAGVYTYTINSDKYYETDNVDLYDGTNGNMLKGLTVESSNNKTFVVETAGGSKYELKIDSNTLLVDDSKYLDDPTAELGAGPQEGDKIAYVLFDLDSTTPDTAKLVVVQNPKSGSSEGPELSTDVVVVNSDKGSDYAAPTFYRENGTAISLSDMKAALTKTMTADGCTDIKFVGNTKVTFTKGGMENETTFTTPLSAATHQVFKYTVNGGAAKYALAGTDIKGDVNGGKYFTADGGKTFTATGSTLNISKDTNFVDGYYAVNETVKVSGTPTNLNGATFSGKVTSPAVVSGKAYIKSGETVTITLTCTNGATTKDGVVTAKVTADKDAVIGGDFKAAADFLETGTVLSSVDPISTKTLTATVTNDADGTPISGDVALTVTLDNKA